MTQLGMFTSDGVRMYHALPFDRPEGDEIEFDYFAGGGGASEGFRMALGRDPAEAVNHDLEALAIHEANHPGTRHHRESVWKIDPVKIAAGRPVGAAWFSPDCTDFSKAKGGKPVRKKIRGLAWVVVRVATQVRPRILYLENVEEFEGWGPLIKGTDRRDPSRAGQTFRAFVRKLRRLGYEVEWRQLRGCDYGAPTTRKRLFLIARCDGDAIVWPKPTHGVGRAHPYNLAAGIIDWSIPCPSIFLTKAEAKELGFPRIKRPLVDNTLRRIARGVWKFVINNPKPFIVSHHGVEFNVVDVNMSGGEERSGLLVPFVAGVGGRQAQSPEHGLNRPYHTITSKGDSAIVTPYIIPVTHGGDARVHSVEEPVRTVTGAHRGEYSLIAPTLIQTGYGEDKKRNGGKGQPPRALDLQQPLGVVVGTGNKHALCTSFLAKHFGGHETPGSPLNAPIDTVTERDHHAIVASSLVKLKGTARDAQALTEPLHTVQSGGNHYAEVRAFLIKYHANGGQWSRLDAPAPTVVSNDSIGLVTVQGAQYAIVDIGQRMLVPRELARAQGFRDSYVLDLMIEKQVKRKRKGKTVLVTELKPLSNEAKTSMIGNSVNPQLAAALVSANYRPMRVTRERVA